MTPKDFAAALTKLSQLVASQDVGVLATIFAQSPEKTTAATLKKLSTMQGTGSHELTAVLHKASAFAKSAGAAKFSGLLDSLSSIVASHGASDTHAFAMSAIALLNAPKASKKATVAARPDVVRAFVKRLEECLGDEGFTVPYGELENDTAISNAEVVAIARTFTTKKPVSRPKALQAIWARHHALLVSQSKSDSRGGRSAA
jgi:hypothetical protein